MRFGIKYVRYLLVRVTSAELIQARVVAFNLYFYFSKPITHFLANSSGVTKRCLSFVILQIFF